MAETAGRSGLGPALVQRADLTASHIAAALTLAVAVAVPLTATLWILAPLLCRLVGAPAAAPVLRILSWSVALSGAGLVSEHLLHRRLRFRALMTAALLSQAVGNGLVAIVLRRRAGRGEAAQTAPAPEFQPVRAIEEPAREAGAGLGDVQAERGSGHGGGPS